MALTRDQIYIIVRETVSGFGSLPVEWSQDDFQNMKLTDLKLDSTNTSSQVGQIDFVVRLQNKFKSQGYQVNITEADVFDNVQLSDMKGLIDLCAKRQRLPRGER